MGMFLSFRRGSLLQKPCEFDIVQLRRYTHRRHSQVIVRALRTRIHRCHFVRFFGVFTIPTDHDAFPAQRHRTSEDGNERGLTSITCDRARRRWRWRWHQLAFQLHFLTPSHTRLTSNDSVCDVRAYRRPIVFHGIIHVAYGGGQRQSVLTKDTLH